MFIDDTPDLRKVWVICHDKWQCLFAGLVSQEALSIHMPTLLFGLINDLLLITSLVELFREIFTLFSKASSSEPMRLMRSARLYEGLDGVPKSLIVKIFTP